MTPALRILIVSDNMLSRAGLAALLASQPDCDVIGQTALTSLTDDATVDDADVLLVELGWQIADSMETLADLDLTDMPIVALLNAEEDSPTVIDTLAAFERYGLLLSEIEPDTLLLALRTVAAGLVVVDPVLSAVLTTPSTVIDPVAQDLTPRENDVLQLLAQGMTNKAIAHQLGITDHTVKFHVNAIMTKFGAQSRTEAVVLATRAGLIIL